MKIAYTGIEAKLNLKAGIDATANKVKITLGKNGSNAVIKRKYLPPLITNDAKTIIDEDELDDETQDLGRELLKMAVDSAHEIAGDGRTNTTVLLQAVLDKGFKKLTSMTVKSHPMDVRDEINRACKEVLNELDNGGYIKKIKTEKEISDVATIAVESREIGNVIAKMFKDLGKDALINIQDGFNGVIETESVSGTEINAGLAHKRLSNTAEIEYVETKPKIAITNIPIISPSDISKIIQGATEKGLKSLILVCESFEKSLYELVVQLKESEEFTLIPIKAPTVTKSYILEDLAILLGTEMCDKEISTLSNIVYGECNKIVVEQGKTTFFGLKGDTKDRIAKLKEELKESESLYDRDKLKDRIQKLSGGIGVIKVDGSTDTERGYLKLKIRDAVNATRKAMEEGVVRGGGLTLKQIADKLEPNILTECIKEPYRLILESGIKEIGEEIIDPVKVVRTSLEKACYQAGLILTLDISIAIKREKPSEIIEKND